MSGFAKANRPAKNPVTTIEETRIIEKGADVLAKAKAESEDKPDKAMLVPLTVAEMNMMDRAAELLTKQTGYKVSKRQLSRKLLVEALQRLLDE
jgi:hypothetical protein